jgi:hypothetical protein
LLLSCYYSLRKLDEIDKTPAKLIRLQAIDRAIDRFVLLSLCFALGAPS